MINATIYELTDYCMQRLAALPYARDRWFVVNYSGMAIDVYNHKENADNSFVLYPTYSGLLRVVRGTPYKLDKMISEDS